jgi:hypothetical protein
MWTYMFSKIIMGFTFDLDQVEDNKILQWKDTKHDKFLVQLFSTY